jgi:hypothetical protein
MTVVIVASIAFLLVFLRGCLRAIGPGRGLLLQAHYREESASERVALGRPRSCRSIRQVRPTSADRTCRRTGVSEVECARH